jgi:hypothetical protein
VVDHFRFRFDGVARVQVLQVVTAGHRAYFRMLTSANQYTADGAGTIDD